MPQEFERFPANWRAAIEREDRVGISPISCCEIALARNKGRLALPLNIDDWDIDDWFSQALSPAGIELLPSTEEIARRAVDLTPIHKDPFDRMIIATALSCSAKLASVDSLFPQYPELKDWLLAK